MVVPKSYIPGAQDFPTAIQMSAKYGNSGDRVGYEKV